MAHGLTAEKGEHGVFITYEGLGEPSPVAYVTRDANGVVVAFVRDADGGNVAVIDNLTEAEAVRLALDAVYARTCALVDRRNGYGPRPAVAAPSDR